MFFYFLLLDSNKMSLYLLHRLAADDTQSLWICHEYW